MFDLVRRGFGSQDLQASCVQVAQPQLRRNSTPSGQRSGTWHSLLPCATPHSALVAVTGGTERDRHKRRAQVSCRSLSAET